MSSFQLPEPIANYFQAKLSSDPEAILALFSDHATVWDNGEDRELRGFSQIREWLSGTVSGYKLSSNVVSCEQIDDEYVVGSVVSGDFPGSPYKFENRFMLEGEKIMKLIIEPIGSLAA